MARPAGIQSYRRHKQSGQAVVCLPDALGGRHDVLLGKHGTAARREDSARVIAEREANSRRLLPTSERAADLTTNELALVYWRFAEVTRFKDGRPTSEQDTIRRRISIFSMGPSCRRLAFGAMPRKPALLRGEVVPDPFSLTYMIPVRSFSKRAVGGAPRNEQSRSHIPFCL
jgi:hypothetical protein